jgi:secretion/DNA translocation related TadE-like protein
LKDRGSATIWVLACVLLLSAAASLVLVGGFVAVDRHRASTVADLAALAAAGRALDGESAACSLAQVVAQAQRARVLECHIDAEGAVIVEVEVSLSGPLAALPPARVRARAGPPAPQ